MKEVLIEIKGKQIVDEESDVIELTTVGKMDTVGDKTYIRYDDSTAVESDIIACMIKYDPKENSVIMQRSGTLNSRMYIKKGQRHICHYETGQGVLTMGVFGEDVNAKMSKEGGSLKLSYTIDVNYGLMSRNEVEINVKEV